MGKVLEDLRLMRETVWVNNNRIPAEEAAKGCAYSIKDMEDAEKRLLRFAPLIEKAFPETAKTHGIIESPLCEVKELSKSLNVPNLYMKLDSELPISGSVKSRGGIYEVLKTAESICFNESALEITDDYSVMLDDKHRELLSKYSIAVGSTGNLGLSIGIMAAKLGFRVAVHMSSDARQWKKDKLRNCGCTVFEYDNDYSVAVESGRAEAAHDPYCHFVDDENSAALFMGYSVAALRLKKQLEDNRILVDQRHPLFVYLPCGVGGAPGGIAFGLTQVFGDAAHCYFAEPTHSPCMTLGLCTGKHNKICVGDIGLDNKTAADGLAVGRASGLVGRIMQPTICGSYTVSDEHMFEYLRLIAKLEGVRLEPSATVGVRGAELMKDETDATHIIWTTGGSMVPQSVMLDYLK